MSETAQISYNGNTYDLPVIIGTEDEVAIDISKFYCRIAN
jgi:citrate synthase